MIGSLLFPPSAVLARLADARQRCRRSTRSISDVEADVQAATSNRVCVLSHSSSREVAICRRRQWRISPGRV